MVILVEQGALEVGEEVSAIAKMIGTPVVEDLVDKVIIPDFTFRLSSQINYYCCN